MATQLIVSESFKSFIQERNSKISKYLADYYFYQNLPIYQDMFNGDDVNYLTFRKDGTISYLPKGKTHEENEDGTWKRDNRQAGKPSKIIQKTLNPRFKRLFKPKDFENFANSYKKKFSDNGFRFELWDANKIGRVYDMTIAEDSGSLGNSCMNRDSYCMDIYENCNFLKILVYLNEDNLLLGRALVWTIDENMTLMDRVYTTQDWMVDSFTDYARENNWWHKRNQNYSDKTLLVSPTGECIDKKLYISLDTQWDSYPYIDTFTHGGDGFLQNYRDSGCVYEYTKTDGTREGDEDSGRVWDEIDECYIDEDDSVSIDRGRYADYTTHINNTVYVESTGRYYWVDDDNIVKIGREFYEKDSGDIFCCPIDDEYYLLDDGNVVDIGVHDGEVVHEGHCITLYDGYICTSDDDTVELYDGSYALINDDNIVEIDGTYYPKDCDEVVEIDGEYKLAAEHVE